MVDSQQAVQARRCNVCGGALETRYPQVVDPQSRETFAILACCDCGLGHTDPQPEDLGRYYGPAYHGGRHGFTARYCMARRGHFLAKVAGAGEGRRLLDVGCGDGSFLLEAKAHGWQVFGTEMNPSLARKEGLEVGERLSDVASHAPFDCITLWHSLEHMRDPRATIAEAVALLAPGGALLVAVPDAEGVQARAFGPGWFHLDVPRHLFHFGARSLTRLLEDAGLEVLRRWHQELELDLFGWTQSALNRVLPEPNLLFYRLTGRPTSGGAAQVAASYLLGSAATLIAIPAVVGGTSLGRGGTLVFGARKRPS